MKNIWEIRFRLKRTIRARHLIAVQLQGPAKGIITRAFKQLTLEERQQVRSVRASNVRGEVG